MANKYDYLDDLDDYLDGISDGDISKGLANLLKSQDPNFIQKLAETRAKPEYREKMSASVKDALSRPEVKEKLSEAIKESHSRPEVKEKLSAASKKNQSSSEYKAKRSKISKEIMSRTEIKEKHSAAVKDALSRPEVKEKHVSSIKKACSTKEFKEKMSLATSGAKNANYKGIIIGTNIITSEEIKFIGAKELVANGFHAGAVSQCILGRSKSHKGYTWRREKK